MADKLVKNPEDAIPHEALMESFHNAHLYSQEDTSHLPEWWEIEEHDGAQTPKGQ